MERFATRENGKAGIDCPFDTGILSWRDSHNLLSWPHGAAVHIVQWHLPSKCKRRVGTEGAVMMKTECSSRPMGDIGRIHQVSV